MPSLVYHFKLLQDSRKQFWEFYDELLTYRQRPTSEERARLDAEFDKLLSICTGFDRKASPMYKLAT